MEPSDNGSNEVNKPGEGFGQGGMNSAPAPVPDSQGKKKVSKATIVFAIIAILALGAAGALAYLFMGSQATLKSADQTIESLFTENAELKQGNNGNQNQDSSNPDDPVSTVNDDESLIKAAVTSHMRAKVVIGESKELEIKIMKTNGKFAQVSAAAEGEKGAVYTLKKVKDSWVIIHHGIQGPFESERDAYGLPEGYYVESE